MKFLFHNIVNKIFYENIYRFLPEGLISLYKHFTIDAINNKLPCLLKVKKQSFNPVTFLGFKIDPTYRKTMHKRSSISLSHRKKV